ncbi:helix-turn-helix protein [Herbihabitans rhizosphaerae]|uniref:Helix-turn-helix protein n=1 Tax=Herbihabitans rhizosphaerae TaxID=1872711 RepID=A0A4V2ESB3_9PSEU|nr:helix-turn-helix transcriptional regulator [Herbihabitans rhizosphaerae]RZS36973.1 helix-turn-helix protein [Herbihabitans rhizosphaerae]
MSRGSLPPLVHRIICGRKLAELRLAADMSQEEVAEATGWSQSKIVHVEGAGSGVDHHDLEVFLELYKAEEATREECRELASLGKKQAPRRPSVLRNHFKGNMRLVIDMESSAATIWRHNSMVIPGLLQTEDYMRYTFRAYRPSLSTDQIDQYTENRLARQRFLDNDDQQYWFVIHEAALRSLEGIDGGTSVLKGQITRLLDAIDRPNIEVQVAPFRHGYYPGQQETYAIFGFDSNPEVQVTYVEKHDGGDILHDQRRLARFRTSWEHQRVHALGPEQTRPFLREMLRSS